MTVTTQARVARASSLASSATFRTFAVVFAIATPIIYVICEMRNWPLFTYFPASGRVTLGWAPGTEAEGPAMHWYGWTAVMLIGSALLGAIATMLPESMTRRIPLWLIWVLPLAAIPVLIYALRFYWRW
jgi:hypothetical protein